VFLIGLSNALPTPDMTYAMGAGAVALFQLYAGMYAPVSDELETMSYVRLATVFSSPRLVF
jgi:hypothetical protein